MAGLLNQVELKMVLTAQNDAQAAFNELLATVKTLKEQMATLGDAPGLADSATLADELATNLKKVQDAIVQGRDSWAAMETLAGDLGAAGKAAGGAAEQVDKFTTAMQKARDMAFTGLVGQVDDVGKAMQPVITDANKTATELRGISDVSMAELVGQVEGVGKAFQPIIDVASRAQADLEKLATDTFSETERGLTTIGDDAKTAATQVDSLTKALDALRTAQEKSGINPNTWKNTTPAGVQQLMANNPGLSQAEAEAILSGNLGTELPGATGGAGATGKGAASSLTLSEILGGAYGKASGAISSLNEFMSGLSSKALMGAMNVMMAGFGLQGIANAGNQFSAIQTMMKMNRGFTVNQSAQALAMLGTQGYSGSSATSFLSGMVSTIKGAFFTQNGNLNSKGIQLRQEGIPLNILGVNPWEVLTGIGNRYNQLTAQGNDTAAQALVGQTGTSGLQAMFLNWSSLQKQASGINLNMTPTQLNQAVVKGQNLAMSMQSLTLDFEKLAVDLAPLANGIVKALGGIEKAFTSGKGPIQDVMSSFKSLDKNVGPLATGLAAAYATVKAAGLLQAGAKTAKDNPALALGTAVGFGIYEEMQGLNWASTHKGQLQSSKNPFAKLLGNIILPPGSTKLGSGGTGYDMATILGLNPGPHAPTGTLPSASGGLGALASGLKYWASSLTSGAAKALENSVGGVIGDAKKWASDLVADVGKWLVTTPHEVASNALSWGKDLVGRVGQQLVKTPNEIFKAATTWAGNLLTAVTTALHNTVVTIANAVYADFSQIQAAAEAALAGMERAGSHIPVIGSGLGAAATGSSYQSQVYEQFAKLLGSNAYRNASTLAASGAMFQTHTASNGTMNITVSGVNSSDKALAQKIAGLIVNALKLKGNFDFSF